MSSSLLCRQYRIPIKSALNSTTGAHSLKIVIQPAAQEANARAAKYAYNVPGLTQPGGMSYYNYLRKPASDFGWDWGPAFTPSGLYGTVEVQAYSTAILTGALPQIAALRTVIIALHVFREYDLGKQEMCHPCTCNWQASGDLLLPTVAGSSSKHARI